MISLLFPDFLENINSYDASERLWRNFFDKLAAENNFTYYNYMNPNLSNGEKDRSANPMFTAAIHSPDLGVRIIQVPTEDDQDFHITGWFDLIEDYEGLPTIEELVIGLVLSEESMAIAEKWIRAWLVEKVSKDQMKKIVVKNRVFASKDK